MGALQVEPVKWSPQRMRKVLNNAILTGNVGDDMIACAETALGEGFEGSLSRSDTSCAAEPPHSAPVSCSCCTIHCHQ